MKTIILVFLLSVMAFGQSNMLLLMGDGYKIQNFEVETYVDTLTITISDEQIERVDNFVTMLKDSLAIDSLAEKFDIIYLLANATEELALRNLVKRDHDVSNVNNYTFTAYEGFGRDTNTVSYLNTNYVFQTDKVNLTYANQSIGIYTLTDKPLEAFDFGSTETTNNYSSRLAASYSNATNAAITRFHTYNDLSIANLNSWGFHQVTRNSLDTVIYYENGAELGRYATWTVNAATFTNPFFIGALGNNAGNPLYVSQRKYGVYTMSEGLSADESLKLYNCINWYMTQMELPTFVEMDLDTRAKVDLTTYVGSNDETIHPSVVDIGEEWNGYRYWMANTPFPSLLDSGAYHENPSIWASNDLETWAVPIGLSNPIVPNPGVGKFNADPDLFFENDTLYCFYGRNNGGTLIDLLLTKSTNGISWSSPVLLSDSNYIRQPSIIKDNGTYYIYAPEASGTKFYRVQSNDINGTYGNKTSVSVSNLAVAPWHLDIIKVNQTYIMTIFSIADGKIYFAFSEDGLTFENYFGRNLLALKATNNWEDLSLYRGSLLNVSGENYKLFYGTSSTTGYNTGMIDLRIILR